ncbi:bleomycin hydrolase [Trichonephila clavata]|uniref:Bleomycin hydrolase n=1 Tax=Trichonephila clavata TaxID=2740835 RepID=A0A8X6KJF5_TRICU|nr:bleomycin hydrolase [Trichonephila clavata]
MTRLLGAIKYGHLNMPNQVCYILRAKHLEFVALHPSILNQFRKNFEASQKNLLALNACAKTDPLEVCQQRHIIESTSHVFTHKVDSEIKPITNQKNSGRCWLFAALNVLRIPFVKQHQIEDFEFSQSCLFFWDKIERSNFFLHTIEMSSKEGPTLILEDLPDAKSVFIPKWIHCFKLDVYRVRREEVKSQKLIPVKAPISADYPSPKEKLFFDSILSYPHNVSQPVIETTCFTTAETAGLTTVETAYLATHETADLTVESSEMADLTMESDERIEKFFPDHNYSVETTSLNSSLPMELDERTLLNSSIPLESDETTCPSIPMESDERTNSSIPVESN